MEYMLYVCVILLTLCGGICIFVGITSKKTEKVHEKPVFVWSIRIGITTVLLLYGCALAQWAIYSIQ
jgi:hypothetical protein